MNQNRRIALLERKAERGTPRGPEAVWRGAQEPTQAGARDYGLWSTVWFRLAVLACLVGFAGVAIRAQNTDTRPLSDDQEDTEVIDRDDNPDRSDQVSSPDRILIGNLTMGNVQVPIDPETTIDPDYIDQLSPRVSISEFPTEIDPSEYIIFADKSAPFDNPILGIELLNGGGFRPWGVNLGNKTVASLSESLVRSDDGWAMDDSSELVEVARFNESHGHMLRFGWQVDFGSDPNDATWQAEPHNGFGPWPWITRLTGSSDNQPAVSIRHIEVLGQPGIVLDRPGATLNADEVIWVSGDYVYRLTTGRAYDTSASVAMQDLRIVDDAEWDAAMARANSWGGEGQVLLIDLIVIVLWLCTAAYVVIRGPRLLAVLGFVAVAAWWVLGPVWWLTLVLVVGLGGLWFHLRGQAKASTTKPEQSV